MPMLPEEICITTAEIWHDDPHSTACRSMTSATAQKLLGSGKIKLKGCKSAKTGNTFDATVYMEVFEDGKTRFNMEFDNGGKRK